MYCVPILRRVIRADPIRLFLGGLLIGSVVTGVGCLLVLPPEESALPSKFARVKYIQSGVTSWDECGTEAKAYIGTLASVGYSITKEDVRWSDLRKECLLSVSYQSSGKVVTEVVDVAWKRPIFTFPPEKERHVPDIPAFDLIALPQLAGVPERGRTR